MRLPTEFVKLPIRVDAETLAAEILALPEQVWRDHPEGAAGNTAVPLVAREGDPFDDAAVGPMRPTPYLESLPYTARVLASLGSVIGRTRLMRIEEEGHLDDHVDTNSYWRDHVRVHVPVVTTPDVRFVCNGLTEHMAAGEVWVFDTWKRHGVDNPAGTKRIHLVIDTVGSAGLWELIEHPDRAEPIVIAPDGPPLTLVTENVSGATVMTPWELAEIVDQLRADVASSDPADGARFEEIVRPYVRAWRESWARYGDQPAGLDTYRRLVFQLDAAVEAEFADRVLPNKVEVLGALRQHIGNVALRSRESVVGRGAADARRGPRREALAPTVAAVDRSSGVRGVVAPVRAARCCSRPWRAHRASGPSAARVTW